MQRWNRIRMQHQLQRTRCPIYYVSSCVHAITALRILNPYLSQSPPPHQLTPGHSFFGRRLLLHAFNFIYFTFLAKLLVTHAIWSESKSLLCSSLKRSGSISISVLNTALQANQQIRSQLPMPSRMQNMLLSVQGTWWYRLGALQNGALCERVLCGTNWV